MKGLKRLFSSSQNLKGSCDSCKAGDIIYRCTCCNRVYCNGCIHTFGERAARILTERVTGNRGGILTGTAKIFDDEGKAFCPHCYGNILDRAVSTGEWVVESENEMDPTCVQIENRATPSTIPDDDFDSLIKALKVKYPFARSNAAKSLGEMRDRRAVKYLIKVFKKDKDNEVRSDAAEALGKIGGEEAIELFIRTLKDKDKEIQEYAGDALVEIGKPAIEKLIHTLKDEDRIVRNKVADILNRIGWKPEEDTQKANYLIAWNNWDELVKLGKPAVKSLIQVLNDKDKDVRSRAADALGKIGDKRAVEPLIQAFRAKDWGDLRFAAGEVVIALGKLGDEKAVDSIIHTLNEDHFVVQRQAVEALGMIGGELAVDVLIQVLEHDWEVLRMDAASALDRLGWKPDDDESKPYYLNAKKQWDKLIQLGNAAVEPLILSLGAKDRDIRNNAAIALGKIGNEEAVEPLILALIDEDRSVNVHAEDALVEIGKPAVEPLIFAMDAKNEDIRKDAMRLLKRITNKDFGENVEDWLEWWWK